MAEVRSGIGFDVHRFDDARPLRLGGVELAGAPGLAGHSDGDVVAHAIADAILGAAALGDVGEHFPESDPAVAGIAGAAILERTIALARDAGFELSSTDVTVIAERPAIAPRRAEIRAALSRALGIGVDRVSVKASRPEGLGLTGEGIGCLAVVVLDRR